MQILGINFMPNIFTKLIREKNICEDVAVWKYSAAEWCNKAELFLLLWSWFILDYNTAQLNDQIWLVSC